MSSRQLVLSQVTSLCQIYQKMDNNKLFNNSPQKVHLVCTISRLFQDMVDEDKLKICSMFNVRDDANRSLWFCLKICNLPKEALFDAEEVILDQFRIQMQKLIVGENDDIHDVIQLMNLASTCPYTNRDEDIEHLLLQAWAKACPENVPRLVKQLHRGNYGYYKYVEALSLLTESMIKMFHGNGAHLVQVIHIISNIVQAGSQELKFLVINILCQLANIETNDPNKHIADQLFTKTFTELFENNPIIRSKLFKTLTKYNGNNLLRIKNIANKDAVLKDQWTHYIKHGTMKQTSLLRLKEQLYSTMDNEYCHKCLEQIVDLTDTGSLTSQKTLSNNFDLIDIETLFEDEGEKAYETEPVCKKPKLEKADATEHFRKKPLMEKADETVAVCKNTKLNYDEADDIISRLESDTKLLCKIKENLFTPGNKKRLKTVCNKLMNIFD